MKVTATTLPRRSVSDSRALSWVVSVNSGAGPIFERRPVPLGSRLATVADQVRVASTTSTIPQSVRRLTLSLQLLLELIEKTPVGAVGDDLLRARLDHPGLVQTQSIESNGIRRLVIAPLSIGHLCHRLHGIVVALDVSLVDEELRGLVRLQRAELGRFQDGTYGSFGGDGVAPHKFLVADDHAAEILRPRSVRQALHQHAADPLRSHFLGQGGKTKEGIDLALLKQPGPLLDLRVDVPVDIPRRIEANVGRNHGEEEMSRGTEAPHDQCLAL